MRATHRLILTVVMILALLTQNLASAPVPVEVTANVAQEEDYYIDLRFTGLMAFSLEEDKGRMKVNLHSEADYHNVTIVIVSGPQVTDKPITYPYFLVREAKENDSFCLKFEAQGAVDCERGTAYWGSPRAFRMTDLHSDAVEEKGELRPTLTVNAGEFKGKEEREVKFKNKNGAEKCFPKCPTAIESTIKLKSTEKASLVAANGKVKFEFPKSEKGGTYKVQISNLPDSDYIEDHHHFKHYYDGTRVLKDGKKEKVKEKERFEAHPPKGLEAHSPKPKVRTDKFVIPSRPCIPISY